MNVVLVTIGIVCIVATLVGGKVKLAGSEFPPIPSRVVRGLLGLVGLSTLLLGLFPDKLNSSTPEAREGESSTAKSAGPATSGLPSSNTTDPEQPLWHGTMLLNEKGIDFSTDPPRLGHVNDLSVDIAEFTSNTLYGSVFTGSVVAKWTQPGEPSPADCSDLLTTHGVTEATFDRQDRFCVRSGDSGRIVLITAKGKQDTNWEIEATVWRPRS